MKPLTPTQRRWHIAAVVVCGLNVVVGALVMAVVPNAVTAVFMGYCLFAGARSTAALRRKARASVSM